MKLRPNLDPELYYTLQNHRSGSPEIKTRFFEIIPHVNKNEFILDVGTRRGALLSTLYEMGYKNIYGCDIGKRAEKYWKNNLPEELQSNVKLWDIHNGNPFPYTYSLIILSHVFEHLYDPKLVSSILYDSLTPNGKLFVKLPLDYVERKMSHTPHYTFFESENDVIKFFNSMKFKSKILNRGKDGKSVELTLICEK